MLHYSIRLLQYPCLQLYKTTTAIEEVIGLLWISHWFPPSSGTFCSAMQGREIGRCYVLPWRTGTRGWLQWRELTVLRESDDTQGRLCKKDSMTLLPISVSYQGVHKCTPESHNFFFFLKLKHNTEIGKDNSLRDSQEDQETYQNRVLGQKRILEQRGQTYN